MKDEKPTIYKVNIDGDDFEIGDQEPTGRQLLRIADKEPESKLIFYFDEQEVFEDLGLDQTVTLSSHGKTRFTTFKADRSFRLSVDGTRHDWGAPKISARIIQKRFSENAGLPVWIERKDEADQLLKPRDVIDLEAEGIETFYSAFGAVIVVNGTPKTVREEELTYASLVALAFPTPPTGANICITISYRKGPSGQTEGTVVEGGKVTIVNRMVFNATATDKS